MAEEISGRSRGEIMRIYPFVARFDLQTQPLARVERTQRNVSLL